MPRGSERWRLSGVQLQPSHLTATVATGRTESKTCVILDFPSRSLICLHPSVPDRSLLFTFTPMVSPHACSACVFAHLARRLVLIVLCVREAPYQRRCKKPLLTNSVFVIFLCCHRGFYVGGGGTSSLAASRCFFKTYPIHLCCLPP